MGQVHNSVNEKGKRMPEPWFKRWGWIGYKPIHRNGLILLVLMVAGFGVFAALSIHFIVSSGTLSTIFGILAAVTGLAGHLVITYRMCD